MCVCVCVCVWLVVNIIQCPQGLETVLLLHYHLRPIIMPSSSVQPWLVNLGACVCMNLSPVYPQ